MDSEPGRALASLKALHTEAAANQIREAVASALPRKGSVEQEIRVRTEISSLAEGEEALILIVVKAGNIRSDLNDP